MSLHIQTAQDFLENLTDLGIVDKKEVFEKKRPYFRYTLIQTRIKLDLDLSIFEKENPGEGLSRLIRERKENGANFTIARSGNAFSTVTVWEGEGRERQERRISLTTPQGEFLFHLPFPQARPLAISDIIEKSGIAEEYSKEIQDIVDELIRLDVIEVL